ncbi:MAG: DUF5777 family beta-barrel protein [Leptospiraceae bacterium]|nr:DUF5777 family beta-barrel protein [Leptospiraceae bacterium]
MKYRILVIILTLVAIELSAQKQSTDAFLGTNLISIPTTKQLDKSSLEFRVSHRFGNGRATLRDLGGLDNGSNTQLSLDYGIMERVSVGIARTSSNKTYEARTKVLLFSESNSFPFSISYFGAAGWESQEKKVSYSSYIPTNFPPSIGNPILDLKAKEIVTDYFTSDVTSINQSYLSSILISKKFGEYLSLQMSPMYVHRNYTKSRLGNDRVGLGFGGRIKITKSIHFTFEAIALPKRDYVAEDYEDEDRKDKLGGKQLTREEINSRIAASGASYNNQLALIYLQNIAYDKTVQHYYTPFSTGVDIETNGHVFSIFLTNNRNLAHTQLLRGADYNLLNKDFTIGFNISRMFWFGEE